MMRLQRVSVIVLSLLTSAASAYAECAWVLWSRAQGLQNWSPTSGWESRASCEEARQKVAFTPLTTLGAAVERTDVTFTCLPDTVDPRGPKGK